MPTSIISADFFGSPEAAFFSPTSCSTDFGGRMVLPLLVVVVVTFFSPEVSAYRSWPSSTLSMSCHIYKNLRRVEEEDGRKRGLIDKYPQQSLEIDSFHIFDLIFSTFGQIVRGDRGSVVHHRTVSSSRARPSPHPSLCLKVCHINRITLPNVYHRFHHLPPLFVYLIISSITSCSCCC